jgi:hypothetical protein
VSQVKDWNFILHDGTRISERDLLQSMDISPAISAEEEPSSSNRKLVDTYDVSLRWRQQGRLLLFDALTRTVRFNMPLGWTIQDTHPDLFRLAHYLLTSPWEQGVLNGWIPTREKGWRFSLSYSAGVDSHACLELMPKNTVVMYHERVGFKSALNHTNALEMLDALQDDGYAVVRIESNHEQIRFDRGKSPGFSTDLAVGVHAVLMADFFGFSGVAFGTPLENSFLFHGHTGRDFLNSKYWIHHKSIFEKAGLDLILPTAGLSELINLKITEHSKHGSLAQSCLRSNVQGATCGACWKCFRKNSLRGDVVKISDEVHQFLNKEPLKQAASTIFALQQIRKRRPKLLVPYSHLEPLMNLETDWLNRHHPQSDRFVPEEMRPSYVEKLEKFSSPMTDNERIFLETLELYGQKEE